MNSAKILNPIKQLDNNNKYNPNLIVIKIIIVMHKNKIKNMYLSTIILFLFKNEFFKLNLNINISFRTQKY